MTGQGWAGLGWAGQGRAGQGRAGKEELCIYKSRVLLPVNKNSFCENHKAGQGW